MVGWSKNSLSRVGAFVFLIAGCTGEPLTVEDMAPEEAYTVADAGPVAMRRLTQVQFKNCAPNTPPKMGVCASMGFPSKSPFGPSAGFQRTEPILN